MACKIDYEKTNDHFSGSSVDSDFTSNLLLPATMTTIEREQVIST